MGSWEGVISLQRLKVYSYTDFPRDVLGKKKSMSFLSRVLIPSENCSGDKIGVVGYRFISWLKR
jgi:hypothetical protein